MEPVYPYLRKSRALGDPDDPQLLATLLDAHRAALTRLANANGIHLRPEQFIMEIGSGETIAQRPKFSALLAHWERLPRDHGGIILVTELERLSRGSMSERGRIADALIRADIHILTPGRRYNLRSPDDVLLFAILSELGQHELGKYKQRQALKLGELLRVGRSPNGQEPFGYKWHGKPVLQFVPDPARFLILQAWCEEIFVLSVDRIAAKWGVPRHVVAGSLHNPTICGWPARRTAPLEDAAGFRKLPRAEWLWPERQGDYPAACTRERWEAIQQVISRRNTTRAKTTDAGNGWCRDVVRFVGCPDRPAQRNSSNTHPPADPRHWIYSVKPPGQPRLYIARHLVHAAAEEAILAAVSDESTLRTVIMAYQSRQAPEAPESAPGRGSEVILTERSKAERLLVDLLRREQEEESVIQQRAIAQLRQEREREIQRLTAELQATAGAPLLPDAETVLPLLLANLHRLPDAWARWTDSERRQVANTLLARVWVTVTDEGERAFRREVAGVELQSWLRK